MAYALPTSIDRTRPVRRLDRVAWWILPLGLLIAASWVGWDLPLNNDVSWQYWVARQLRGGARLYRDIVEVNPPLWFWEAVPVSALAERLGVDARHIVVIAVLARAALALALVERLLGPRSVRERLVRIVGLTVLLCLLPLHDFGEREHLMLIGCVPYVMLIARRRAGAAPPGWLASAIGLLAAWGFCLKPHFALVPLALEAWLAAAMGRRWRPLRPETALLVIVATLYGAAVARFAPVYLHATLPLARLAYGAFSPPLADLFFGRPWMPAWIVGAVALILMRKRLPLEARAAAVAGGTLALVYLLQGKGFPYHALPVSALLGWALWLAASAGGAPLAVLARHPLAALALGLMTAGAWAVGPFVPIRAGRATGALERLPPDSSVAVISAHSWLAFPLVEDRRFVWPMRNIGLWTIPKIARDGGSPSGRRVWQWTLDSIAADLWCHPPDAILVDDPNRSPALAGTHFSYEAFLRSDARLRDLLARYRPMLADDKTTLYRPIAPIAAHGKDCRDISVRPDLP